MALESYAERYNVIIHAPETRHMDSNEDEFPLNATDNAILDLLATGRCTPAYIAEETGYSRGNIVNRLTRLREHGHVQKIHKGLYELVDDPRNHEH